MTLEQNLINMLEEVYKDATKEELIEKARIVVKKLEELSGLFQMGSVYENIASEKSIYHAGGQYQWDQFLHKIKSKENYTKALHLITEILDILRGEPLQLDVYKVEKNDKGKTISITHYHGKEADVSLITSKTKYGKNFVEEIQYIKENLEKNEIFDEAFVRHYDKFETVAMGFQKSKNFNQGHIIEAYQRHLYVVQHSDKFSDRLTKKHVAIMLYYSTKNAPWWTGGDVGMSQIKNYNNQRLASQKSIRMVANRLITMAQNPDTFVSDFKKIFTQQELEDMIDPENLSQYSLNELLEGKLKRFNINYRI